MVETDKKARRSIEGIDLKKVKLNESSLTYLMRNDHYKDAYTDPSREVHTDLGKQ